MIVFFNSTIIGGINARSHATHRSRRSARRLYRNRGRPKPLPQATLENIQPHGYASVAPTSGIEVGHLYFSGQGNRPKFVTGNGTVYNAMCYDDFLKTGVERDDQHVIVEEPVRVVKKTVDASRTYGAALSTGELWRIGPGFRRCRRQGFTRLYAGERPRIDPDGCGRETRDAKIGNECRALIKERKAHGSDVILVLNALRADKLTDVTNQYAGLPGRRCRRRHGDDCGRQDKGHRSWHRRDA